MYSLEALRLACFIVLYDDAADGTTWLISDMKYIPWFAPFWVSQTISWSLSINRYVPELIFQAFYGWGWALRCFLEEYQCKFWNLDLNPTNFIDCCGGSNLQILSPAFGIWMKCRGVEQHLGMLCCIFLLCVPQRWPTAELLGEYALNDYRGVFRVFGWFDMIPQFQEVASKKLPSPIWVFPKIVVPQNGWFIMENPIKMDDLGVPIIFGNIHIIIRKSCLKMILLLRPEASNSQGERRGIIRRRVGVGIVWKRTRWH